MSSTRQTINQLTTAKPTGQVKVINKFVQTEDFAAIAKIRQKLQAPGITQMPEGDWNFYKNMHNPIAAKLYRILLTFRQHIPFKPPVLNVISLGSSDADEYLVLKLLLEQHYPACRLNYVGVDIDETNNQIVEKSFLPDPGFRLITANASDPLLLKKTLVTENLQPANGFDFIFLRHPNLLNSEQNEGFFRMVLHVIPFLANEESRVYISLYNTLELAVLKRLIDTDVYRVQDLLQVEGVFKIGVEQGYEAETETHAMLYHVSGYALGLRQEAAHQKLLQDIRELNHKTQTARKMWELINQRKYKQAFRTASAYLELKWLNILVMHRFNLLIDVNEPSPTNNRTALDWAQQSKLPNKALQKEVIDFLIDHDCKNATPILPEVIVNNPSQKQSSPDVAQRNPGTSFNF